MPTSTALNDLHPFEYEHPFDAKALNSLQKTPGLDLLVRQYSKHIIERFVTIQYTGSHIKISNKNYPQLYSIIEDVCRTINLPSCPDLYVQGEGGINGFTIGVETPIIVLTSGAIDLLSDAELAFVIGHEVGHIKSRHVLYKQMAQFMAVTTSLIGDLTLQLGKYLSQPLQTALLRWDRMSEFTADRAGLLACQDVDVASRVMMKLAGVPTKFYNDLNFETFIEQARNFEQLDESKMNMAIKSLLIMGSSHPWSVMRASELLAWISSGEYDLVLKRGTRDRLFVFHDGTNIICRKCEYRLQGEEKFCPVCGSNLRFEAAH